MWRAVVVVMMLVPGLAVADEFGGWKFKPPAGYKKTEAGDHVTLEKVTGKTFCQLTLFASRARGTDDGTFEWQNVVAKNFLTVTPKKPVNAKSKTLAYVATSGDAKDGSGNAFAFTHYVLMPDGAVSSVLLLSSNAASLAKCPAKAFVESIALASPPTPVETTPAAGTLQVTITGASADTPGPTGNAPPFASSWGNSASAYNQGMSLGSNSRQYQFKADGTYRYLRETWGGHYRAGFYYSVEESGTYKLIGNQLALTPMKATGSEYDGDKLVKTEKLALEKMTYTLEETWLAGMQQWYLIMTPTKQTERDGPFSNSDNEKWKSSYMLSGSYKPSWQHLK